MSEGTRPPGADEASEFLTMQEAAEVLGVSRFQMAALVKRLKLQLYEKPADQRVKLLRRVDVEAASRPRPKTERAA